mgnify:FL=1
MSVTTSPVGVWVLGGASALSFASESFSRAEFQAPSEARQEKLHTGGDLTPYREVLAQLLTRDTNGAFIVSDS